MTSIDALVDSYLGAVAQAGADLSPQRREELLADLREHITTARAELNPETEADVRTILDRLGDPANIVAEARQDEPQPVSMPAASSHVPQRRSGSRIWIAILAVLGVALIACCIAGVLGGFLFTTKTGEVSVEEGVSVSTPAQPSHTN